MIWNLNPLYLQNLIFSILSIISVDFLALLATIRYRYLVVIFSPWANVTKVDNNLSSGMIHLSWVDDNLITNMFCLLGLNQSISSRGLLMLAILLVDTWACCRRSAPKAVMRTDGLLWNSKNLKYRIHFMPLVFCFQEGPWYYICHVYTDGSLRWSWKMFIPLPIAWIVDDVRPNSIQFRFIPDDTVIINSLPSFTRKRRPSMLSDTANVIIGRHGFEPLNNAM